MNTKLILNLSVAVLLSISASGAAEKPKPAASAGAALPTLAIDPVHSSVEFSVRHMMVNRVKGRFDRFKGTIGFDERRPDTVAALVEIDAASVNTANEKRDEHLRNEDFFDVAKFPTASFRSKRVEKRDGRNVLVGDLTLHGVTREIAIAFEVAGVLRPKAGPVRVGFHGRTTIDRKDFGIVYNKVLDNGGVSIGEEVELDFEIQAVQEQAAK